MKKYIIILLVMVLGLTVYLGKDTLKKLVLLPTESDYPVVSLDSDEAVKVIANNLSTPWEVAFLPDGNMLVTERTGNVLLVDRATGDRKIVHTSDITETDEGGLLGMVLHPDFESTPRVYLYESYQQQGDIFLNRVVSYLYKDQRFVDQKIIIESIPGAKYHDGGRIAFGPDGKLYIATGDATESVLAQDISSVAGKILRLNDDGSIPYDNPFGDSAVYSYGHRNPQGIAWDAHGQLWSTEHGPSGLETGHDELNNIIPGGNYGWPYFAGTIQQVSRELNRSDYIMPVIDSGDDETWAPASLAYHNGYLYWGGLRGQALYKVALNNKQVGVPERLFTEKYGRIRTVAIHNNNLYITTSNTDGRGFPYENDDKILRIPLNKK